MRIASKYLPLLTAAVALVVLPFALLVLRLPLTAATDVVIFAIAGMGLNILVGQTGVVSFGHGVFFGLAAYAAALAQRRWFPGEMLLPSLVAVVAVAVFAWIVGFLILRRGHLYVAILTLLLSAMMTFVALRWTAVAGGASGLGDIVRPGVLGEPRIYYAIVVLIGFVVVLLLWRLRGSPVGRVLDAIRINEQRARFLGYAAERYKLFAFTASATLAGVAGVLSAFLHHVASPEPISISFSGGLVAIAVIGGMRSLLGPALGALLFVLFRDLVSAWIENWLLVFWLLFVAAVIFSPLGLVGLAERLRARFRKRVIGAAMAGREMPQNAALPAALAGRAREDGPVLIARELAKSFGGIHAVAGADIVVEDRTLHALIGPNGAGKTTAFNLLSGLYPPDAGFVTLAGKPVAGLKPEAITRAGMGRSFQIPNLFGCLTVQQNMRLAVQARSARRFDWWTSTEGRADVNAEAAAFMAYLGLTGLEHAEAASLPVGDQRVVDIGLALATAPRVLLLDEPLAGLPAAERSRVAALLRTIAAHSPVLLAARELDETLEIADTVSVMHDGKIVLQGSPEATRNDARVRALYAGSRAAHPGSDAQMSAAGASMLLKVDKIDTFYGASQVLDAVSLDVAEHEIVALLGRNGAGKSTLLKTLTGMVPPQSGLIAFAGEQTARLTSAEIARRGIGYVPQGRGLFAGMTVADNLALGRTERITGNGVHWDDERIIWVFPRLAQRWYTPADDLSGGERQMVAVARALAGNVRLLLLDEPFEGLSPTIVDELFEAFNRLRYEVAMVIADNRLDLALALSDRSVILEHGAVTWTGASKLLRDDLDFRRQKLWM